MALNSFCTRLFQTKAHAPTRHVPLYQATFTILASFFFACLGRFELPSTKTLLFGLAFGVTFFLACSMLAKGYEIGSMALTAIIVNMSLIIPIIYSIVFLNERIQPLHIVGFLLFLTSVLLSALSSRTQEKNKPAAKGALVVLWLAVVLLGCLANGSSSTLQKIYTMSESQDKIFLAVAYAEAALFFCGQYLLGTRKKHSDSQAKLKVDLPWILVLGLTSSLGSFGGNCLLNMLAPRVDAAVLYPCINGGIALVAALLSFIVFREKPTLLKILSLVAGCGAIVVLNLV